MAPAFAAPAFAEPALATPTFAEPTFAAPAFTEQAFAAPAAVALAEPAVTATFAPAVPSWAGGHGTKAERVLAFARGQIGRPCVRGAVGPGSYDAPGLAQAAWKTAGVTLPRTTQAQAEYGMPIALADVQVGDLVFFHDDLGHVGVWAGNGMMIHAPGPGAQIREESVFFAGHAAIKGAVRPA
ncbi:NlpC/P60 family protein [Streptomyces sp. RG80]|uniref:C40 family peptidase n=1 Tax=Streptomyces sp. RG80 TaxID=3157340 RepID=UPI00338FD77B